METTVMHDRPGKPQINHFDIMDGLVLLMEDTLERYLNLMGTIPNKYVGVPRLQDYAAISVKLDEFRQKIATAKREAEKKEAS